MAEPGKFADPEPLVGDPPRPARRRRWTIRRLILVVALVAFALGIIRPAYLVFDALGHGPYTLMYNRRCQRLADEANLIGRPEADIVAVLGSPTEVWDYEDGDQAKTYNYFPVRFVPAGIFQVHCSAGKVKAVEQLDD